LPELAKTQAKGPTPIISNLPDSAICTLKEGKGVWQIKVGNQLLEGKKETLKQPRLILGKSISDGIPVLEVEAVIKEKICFFTRPKPMRGEKRLMK
jgi:hypothetical protein